MEKATIEETPSAANGHRYLIETDCGRTLHLSGVGAPKGGSVGDHGTVTYQSGRARGFYAWTAE